MQLQDVQSEIDSLQLQLKNNYEIFDQALINNVELKETKKLFHEIKILRERLEVLELKVKSKK